VTLPFISSPLGMMMVTFVIVAIAVYRQRTLTTSPVSPSTSIQSPIR
jgi:hypothetical protein